MLEALGNLQSYHAAEWLFVAAACLILIDYFFPTDWPAHLGYVCIAASLFFSIWSRAPGSPWQSVPSLLLAAGVWLALAILHRFVFRHVLENAPGTQRDKPEPGVEPAATTEKDDK